MALLNPYWVAYPAKAMNAKDRSVKKRPTYCLR